MNYLLPVQCGAPDLNKIFYSKYLNNLNNNLTYENKIQSSISNINNFYIHSDYSKIKLGSYLTGLFEGNGYLYLPSNKPLSKIYPYISITLANKDYPLIFKLSKLIGGNLRIKIKEKVIV
jgi:hypothetical protein